MPAQLRGLWGPRRCFYFCWGLVCPKDCAWSHFSSPVGSAGCRVFYTHFTDVTAEAWTNVALYPGACREDEGQKAEGSFLLPARCCMESSRFASKDLKTVV